VQENSSSACHQNEDGAFISFSRLAVKVRDPLQVSIVGIQKRPYLREGSRYSFMFFISGYLSLLPYPAVPRQSQ
jgi:hypothetical protein